MRRGHAILLLGLLFWVDPAYAQNVIVHPLTVSVHATLKSTLTRSAVEQILKHASDMLQNNGCNGVGFALKGAITPFKTSAPAIIKDEDTLERVHHSPPTSRSSRRSITACKDINRGSLDVHGDPTTSFRRR